MIRESSGLGLNPGISSRFEGRFHLAFFADCQAPLCLFSRNVEFVDLKKHPLPPPKCGFAVIEGELTEENIEKARAAAKRDYERK